MTRRANDFYPTPSWATEMLLQEVPILYGTHRSLEPCAGDGAISDVLRRHGHRVFTNDLDTTWRSDLHGDARDPFWWNTFHGDWPWVISNPPFKYAAEIVRQSLAHADGVAMLLRLTFLEPCEGRELLITTQPPTRLIVLPRISFTGDGKTDNVTCAWFVWHPDVRPGVTVVTDNDLSTPLLP